MSDPVLTDYGIVPSISGKGNDITCLFSYPNGGNPLSWKKAGGRVEFHEVMLEVDDLKKSPPLTRNEVVELCESRIHPEADIWRSVPKD